MALKHYSKAVKHYDRLETRSPKAREKALMAALPRLIAHVKRRAPGFAKILASVDAKTQHDERNSSIRRKILSAFHCDAELDANRIVVATQGSEAVPTATMCRWTIALHRRPRQVKQIQVKQIEVTAAA